MADRQDFDKNGMFDWTQDGKVDHEDYAYYFTMVEDEEEEEEWERRNSGRRASSSCRSSEDRSTEGDSPFIKVFVIIAVICFVCRFISS